MRTGIISSQVDYIDVANDHLTVYYVAEGAKVDGDKLFDRFMDMCTRSLSGIDFGKLRGPMGQLLSKFSQ